MIADSLSVLKNDQSSYDSEMDDMIKRHKINGKKELEEKEVQQPKNGEKPKEAAPVEADEVSVDYSAQEAGEPGMDDDTYF